MRAAIELAEAGRVLVVAKDSLRESSSEYAQGGIAVALSDEDEVSLHEQDTVNAGDGLCERAAVHALVEEGPAAIQQLIEWGAAFDRQGGGLAFTREGAHSRNRVLHAHGDSTGREIAQTLYRKAASLPNITFHSYAATIDLLLDEGVCGASLWDAKSHSLHSLPARAVLLATGGLGNVFRNTTNPDVATGDGVAMAYRAGASYVSLDLTHREPGFVRQRFPRIYETCLRYGVDLERQAAPVAPAAHYAMGGVSTDLDGRTTLSRLYAAGEAACTGVHGANRLASNSLLEGVVFGARAGRAMREWISVRPPALGAPPESHGTAATAAEIRSLVWDKCGIVRDGAGLRAACQWLAAAGRPGSVPPETAEVRNMHQVALLIARCALEREESRGAHFRSDYPQKETAFEKHSVARRGEEIAFR
jgi:L-aspartate oxidase